MPAFTATIVNGQVVATSDAGHVTAPVGGKTRTGAAFVVVSFTDDAALCVTFTDSEAKAAAHRSRIAAKSAKVAAFHGRPAPSVVVVPVA